MGGEARDSCGPRERYNSEHFAFVIYHVRVRQFTEIATRISEESSPRDQRRSKLISRKSRKAAVHPDGLFAAGIRTTLREIPEWCVLFLHGACIAQEKQRASKQELTLIARGLDGKRGASRAASRSHFHASGRTVELSFRRIVFQSRAISTRRKPAKPGRKYRRVIAYGRAIIRAARTYPGYITSSERETGLRGEMRRAR